MRKPRIVLVKPPEESELNFGPFNLAVLAAYIRDITDVVIIDATKKSLADTAEHVWSLKPEIVGITVTGSGSIQPAVRLLKLLTRHNAGSTAAILVGGHGAAAGERMLFLEAGATAVVIGEGEQVLRYIIEHGVKPGAPGIAMQSEGEPCVGPNTQLIQPLDQLPPPARDLIPLPKNGIHLLETSRGCPYRCGFCETTRFFGNTWRAFSPKWVATEVKRLVDMYNAWTILLTDDNFAANHAHVIEICDRLQRGPLPAVFIASARADDLLRHPEVIPALASAKFFRITIGVETLEYKAAKLAGKLIDKSVYRDTFALLRAYGIFSVASFITGLPEQQADPHTVVEQAVEVGPDAVVFVPFIPTPGTSLAGDCIMYEPKTVDRENAKRMTAAFFKHPDVKRRLSEAETAGGIRGLMARATISRYKRLERSNLL